MNAPRSGASWSLHRGERGDKRRQDLIRALRDAERPIPGLELARQVGVSRQVLVQDIAILRAAGADILTSARGYRLRGDPAPLAYRDVLRVRHDEGGMVEEMTLLVDLGLRVLDIAIEHPIYGTLRAPLPIASRQDIRALVARFAETGAKPLFTLTGGRHSHTVEVPRPDLLEKARAALCARGYCS